MLDTRRLASTIFVIALTLVAPPAFAASGCGDLGAIGLVISLLVWSGFVLVLALTVPRSLAAKRSELRYGAGVGWGLGGGLFGCFVGLAFAMGRGRCDGLDYLLPALLGGAGLTIGLRIWLRSTPSG